MAMGIRVTLAGVAIPAGYDGVTPAVVAGVEFTWGRQRVYDQSDPGVLKFSLLDRSGDWAARRDLNGTNVEIRRTSPDRVMFSGSINTATATRVTVKHPTTGAREKVWRVDLTGSSGLAEAAAAVLTGGSTETTREGLGGWGEILSDLRVSGVNNGLTGRGALAVLPGGMEAPPSYVASNVVPRSASVDAARSASVLELLEQVYRNYYLSSVEFEPATKATRIGRLATAAGMALIRSAGRVILQLDSPGRSVPAKLVGVPQGYAVQSTVSEAVDVVQVTYEYYTKDPTVTAGSQTKYAWLSQTIQGTAGRQGTATRRTLKIDSGLIALDPSLFVAGSAANIAEYNRAPAWVRDETLRIVNAMNGQLRLPSLRFDDRRLPLPAALTAEVYNPLVSPTPLYFAGSVFNVLPNAGPQHQIVGGTFRYDDGWTHDVNLVPAISSVAAPLTLQQLAGSSTAPMSIYDSAITLADLSNVTRGLTT